MFLHGFILILNAPIFGQRKMFVHTVLQYVKMFF